jgi:hypothetical protein
MAFMWLLLVPFWLLSAYFIIGGCVIGSRTEKYERLLAEAGERRRNAARDGDWERWEAACREEDDIHAAWSKERAESWFH